MKLSTRLFSLTHLGVIVTMAFMAFQLNWASTAVAVAGLLVLPGALICSALGVTPASRPVRLGAYLAISLTLVMGIGALVSWAGPRTGVDRPLEHAPLLVVWTIILAGLSLWSFFKKADDPLSELIGRPRLSAVAVGSATLVVPVTAALGAQRLNAGGSSDLAVIATIVAIALLVFAVILAAWRPALPVGMALFSGSLALAWSTTLRGGHLFGWDIQKEFGIGMITIDAAQWSTPNPADAYGAMLSLTTLPAQLHSLTGLSLEAFLRIALPIVFVTIPAVIYAMLRRWASPAASATAVALLVIASRTFARQMPAIGRQEVALVICAALLAVLSDRSMSPRTRKVFVVIASVGMAYSHYTTAYVTGFLLFAGWAFAAIADRMRHRSRRSATLTAPVIALCLAAILGWNLTVTKTGTVFERPVQTTSASGIEILPGQEEGLIQAWLDGSGPKIVPVAEYQTTLSELLDHPELDWMVRDPAADEIVLSDERAPTVAGLVPEGKSAWEFGSTLVFQIAVLAQVLGALYVMWRWLRGDRRLPAEIIGMLLGALVFSALLRLSGSAAQFYNPERGAFHMAMLTSIGVAVMLDRVVSWRRRLIAPAIGVLACAALVVMLANTTSLDAYLTGGSPPGALSSSGEDYERFAVSEEEYATAEWLRQNLRSNAVVQTDRYGQLALLTVANRVPWGIFDKIAPPLIDQRAWIYASRTNLIEGRARGLEGKGFAIYSYPAEYFDETRSIVYSSESTRVYH